jgi:hypothetical protein
VHADLGAGGREPVGARVVQLRLVIGGHLSELRRISTGTSRIGFALIYDECPLE